MLSRQERVASTLIRGKYVITRITDHEHTEVLEDGAVFQRGGTIVEVGPASELLAHYAPDDVIGSPAHVLLPGMTDAHHHVGLTPVQFGARDEALEPWLIGNLRRRGIDPYLDTLYSAFELLESGVTTVVHLLGRLPRPLARAVEVTNRIR